jgi:cyclic pyranopterin phosphate synthase
MVDVSEKAVSDREAIASAVVRMDTSTLEVLLSGETKKGDVLAAARIAGIQAAKKTPELIPLCHHVALTSVEVAFEERDATLVIRATARARDRTGVEMEALTAVSVAALTIYDMLKAIDRGMTIDRIQLEEKRGGRSGDFAR